LDSPTKKDKLLANRDVRRWYDNLCRSSPNSGEVALRRLSLFCEQNKTTPKGLVHFPKKRLGDTIQDHISRMEKEKKAPGYIKGLVKSIKSWLAHNGIELKRRFNIANAESTPSLVDERIPTREELRTIFTYSDERGKAASSLVSQAGVRLETLGNMSGTDGLRIGDLPELSIKDGQVTFKQIPTRVVVRAELSKTGHQYFTFLTTEGCEYLSAYVNKRLAEEEAIVASSPVIAVKPGYELKGRGTKTRTGNFVTTRNISRMIRAAMRPAFDWRPYVLRSYFDTQMIMAENNGKIGHPYIVFYMGHVGDMESRYSTHKNRLPEDMIEDMRGAFKKAQEYLQTTKPETQIGDIAREFKKQLLSVAGYTEKELLEIPLDTITNEEVQRRVRERLLDTVAGNGKRQRIVSTVDLENHLAQGWEFVAAPPGLRGRSIVRLPPNLPFAS
jgi:hypothetical protein